MDGLNRVFLIGHLAADPELRTTNGGQAVMQMRVACTEKYFDRNKQLQEKTEWVDVVLWGRQAEGLSKFLSKGFAVHVEGSLQTRTWDDREGNKRYKTEVNAKRVNVLTSPGDGRQQARREDARQPTLPLGGPDEGGFDDIPF